MSAGVDPATRGRRSMRHCTTQVRRCLAWPFCSPRRFAETHWWFGLSVWCGLDSDEVTARRLLEREVERLYWSPGEKFGHVTAAGSRREWPSDSRSSSRRGARRRVRGGGDRRRGRGKRKLSVLDDLGSNHATSHCQLAQRTPCNT